MSKLHWIEIALAALTVATALWQLVLIDQQMVGFVLFWMIAPVVAICIHLRNRTAEAARWWALTYLLMMCAGSALLPSRSVFPAFEAIHPASTDFAEKWNRLDWSSRRIISWNMTLMGASIFWFIGYSVFWLNLPRYRRFGASDLSPQICYVGLFTVWLLPAIALISLVLHAIR